jgi:hypothetical protein
MTLFTEKILDYKQIIEFVQNDKILEEDNTDNKKQLPSKILSKEALDAIKKVILFYKQQPIDNGYQSF